MEQIEEVLVSWEKELDNIKSRLLEIGERGDSFEYNILSSRALAVAEVLKDIAPIVALLRRGE